MFQPQKPAFAPASPYGFNANTASSAASPFGGSAFGKPAGAAPAFGANTSFGATAPGTNAGVGLFGAGATGGGLFGNTATNAATTGFGGFGQTATPAANPGMFGSTPQQPSSGGLFGQPQQQTQPFGANTSGFGFGQAAAAPSSGLFGAAPQTSSLFGQSSTATPGGGLFGNTTTGFGAQQQQSGTVFKYNPVPGTDVMVKAGQSTNINIKHHCITCMKEYESKSLEELRLEDYTAGRRGPQAGAGSVGGMFGAPQAAGGFGAPANNANTPFGQSNKPVGSLFGQNTGFGQPATTTSGGLFGNTSGFGAQQNTFGFGQTTQANTSGTLFGSPKPFGTATQGAGTNLFGATTTQASGAFGAIGTTNNSFGGFGTTPTQTQGLFGKTGSSTGFGLPQTSTAGAGFGFGQTSAAPAGGMFGNKLATAAPAFGTTASAFGAGANAFGATTSSAGGGGLFGGGSAFGAKPATTTAGFGFGQAQQGTGLGTGLTLGNAAGAGLFGGNKAPAAGGLQGFGGGSLFGGQQPSNTNTLGFGTGNTSFGGLGGGLGTSFGSGLGGNTLGQPSLGMGLSGGLGMNTTPNTGFGGNTSGAVNVHEQILSLVARPFGDSPLYKHLVPDSGKSPREDASKATDPAAQRAVLEGPTYKVSPVSNGTRLRVRPLRSASTAHNQDKQASLFDALEESDASLECKLTLRPNAKRLVLRPKQSPRTNGDTSLADVSVAQQINRSRTEEATFETTTKTKVSPESGLSPDSLARRTSHHAVKLRGVYSDLDQNPDSDRRASWLTTKPLVKPSAAHHLDSSNILEQTIAELHSAKPSAAQTSQSSGGLYPSLSAFASSGLINREDKENIDTPVDDPAMRSQTEPHPTGIKLTKPGYYTIPSLDELKSYLCEDGSCVVPCFTVGRHSYGNVHYDSQMDVAGLDIDAIVHFLNKQVIVYPDDVDKPVLGAGLNRQAQVTLDQVWPRDKTARQPITDPARLEKMDYEGKLRAVCDKHETKFIEYRPETGSWVFRVEHFSKYGLTDSDEEDSSQTAGACSTARPPTLPGKAVCDLQGRSATPQLGASVTTANRGLGGLTGSVGLGGLMSGDGLVDIHTQHRLVDGSTKGLAMDTSEEESVDSTSMYADEGDAFDRNGFDGKDGLRSPTSDMARLDKRSSHSVQLMKAFLYQDAECEDMEDDVSQSTPDQLVPQPRTVSSTATSLLLTAGRQHSPRTTSILAPSVPRTLTVNWEIEERNQEVTLRPLIVKPLTVVIKKYKEVIPFAGTIAGRLCASRVSDMGVSHARHFRAGWARGGQIMNLTTEHVLHTLQQVSQLPALGEYIQGRSNTDTSPRLLFRLAVAGGNATVNPQRFAESMEGHLRCVLSHSEVVTSPTSKCPRLVLRRGPDNALSLLLGHLEEAERLAQTERGTETEKQFGVTAEYCYQTWALCKALWGADLENKGVPPTDDLSLLNRHRELSDWLRAAVSDEVERDLAETAQPDPDDWSDLHSASILTLLSGGRQLDACRLARQKRDYNMALLIAQYGGGADECIRTLIGRQLSAWRDCGALEHMSASRVAALLLGAGRVSVTLRDRTVHACRGLSWRRALAVHYWYICQQVSTVSEALQAYEASFRHRLRPFSASDLMQTQEAGRDEQDISVMSQEDIEMQEDGPVAFPHPNYWNGNHVLDKKMGEDGSLRRRTLDLHYTLMKARAGDVRPVIEPASHTPDPLDYRLSFLLHGWLSSAGVCGSVSVSAGTCAGLAAQLEAAGLWQWAIATLMHLEDDVARGQLVRQVLWRHVPASADSQDNKERIDFLQNRLLVPRTWIRLAQAHRAKYENRPELEATHLAAAEQWNSAHKLLLEQLLPDAVLNECLDGLRPLLEQLMQASLQHRVSGWDVGGGGKALYEYMYVCKEMRSIVEDATSGATSSDNVCRESMLGRLEALRPRVAAACAALVLPPHVRQTTRQALARCEMGSRLAHLSLAAVTATQPGGGPLLPAAAARQLTQLVTRLDLPPDYVHHMRAKLMGSITEDFSLEGRNWPPVSTNQSMDTDLPQPPPSYCD